MAKAKAKNSIHTLNAAKTQRALLAMAPDVADAMTAVESLRAQFLALCERYGVPVAQEFERTS